MKWILLVIPMSLLPLFIFFLADKVQAESLPAPVVTESATAESPSARQEISHELPKELAEEIANEDREIPVTAKTKLSKEVDIPVLLDDTKKANSNTSPITKAFLILGGMIILGTGIVYLVRKYAKSAGKKNDATQIKILTQHYLGPKKSLAIIRVAGESILIGVTESNISLIKSLSLLDEDIPNELPSSFEKTMASPGVVASAKEKIKLNFQRKTENLDSSQDDEFAFSGLKDVVRNKLKSMKVI